MQSIVLGQNPLFSLINLGFVDTDHAPLAGKVAFILFLDDDLTLILLGYMSYMPKKRSACTPPLVVLVWHIPVDWLHA